MGGAALALSPFLKWYTVFGEVNGAAIPLVAGATGFSAVPGLAVFALVFSLFAVALVIVSASRPQTGEAIPNLSAPVCFVSAGAAGLIALLVLMAMVEAPDVPSSLAGGGRDYRAEGIHTPGIYLALVATLAIGAGLVAMGLIAFRQPAGAEPDPEQLRDTSGRTAISAPDLKRCPDCAEMVLAEARVCKHCRYRFPQPPAEA